MAVLFTFFPSRGSNNTIPISEVVSLAQSGKVQKLVVNGNSLMIRTWDEKEFGSRKEEGSSVVELLRDAGVTSGIDVEVKGSSGLSNVLSILFSFLPLIFFGGILLFMMRQAQGSNNSTLGFGRSRPRMSVGNRPTVTFADVAGVDEAKEELQEVVEFLKYPERFLSLGARIPRGVLLIGPPGTGKTLMSRAVAGEAGVPFFPISGSEFVEMFVGVGASRVRDLFDQAKRSAPSIIFVDEIDAVGRHRGAGLGGGHDEREQTLNQILVEMDGFDSSVNVIVLAATNRPDILDPALLRPGRFDRRVILDLPDIAGRNKVLEVHSKGKPVDQDVNMEVVAKETAGFSGADLSNLVNEAAILAARRSKKTITFDEFGEAIDRVIAGPERKSRIISHREKEITAYHEGGHALVGYLLPNADPVQKVSIVSRGQMGGYTRFLPSEDRYLMTRAQFKDMIATALGGRVSEELTFKEITTGASNDLEHATSLARKMVTRYGMSEKLGPRTFGKREELVFLGREISEQRDYGDSVAEEIDQEVHALIREAHTVATELLTSHKAKLVQLARHLISHETIEGDELQKLLESDSPPIETAVGPTEAD
jgi:cell division protease FtsH